MGESTPDTSLLNFVDGGCMEGVAEPVELLQIARSLTGKVKPGKGKLPAKRLSLVLDAECCLDRLYGGYFSDWTCGGQWNRMLQFLNQLLGVCHGGNIELTVAFNGALELQRHAQWVEQQKSNNHKTHMVLRHIQNKGTPPPKVWWLPPACLSTTLRLALRYLNIPMICSMDDHHQEVVAHCRENNLNGIMGDDIEYLLFHPPLHFSAKNLKLTFKGLIETKEYYVAALSNSLGLDTQGLCILATILGNHLLKPHFDSIVETILPDPNARKAPGSVVKAVAEFVKNLENTDSLETVAVEIYGNDKSEKAVKQRQLFVESVHYYLNGTKDGFLKYKARKAPKKKTLSAKDDSEDDVAGSRNASASRFASETPENEAGSLEAYAQLADKQKTGSQFLDAASASASTSSASCLTPAVAALTLNGDHSPATNGLLDSPPTKETASERGKSQSQRLPPEVLRTAGERHQKGLMSPMIYQLLTQSEIKLPVILEDEHQGECPSIHAIYQPIRQNVYAIIFNVHHQLYMANKEQGEYELPTVKEWTYPYKEAHLVGADPIHWPVPTIQRLWFGSNVEDVRRRIRAYLTCMKSDTPLMMSAAYIPQHLLVMASVLRYLMQCKVPVLRQLELDAFIVTAFCPDLMDSDYTQDLQLQMVSPRGVQLAALFMQGIETAILANEACGAPIPYLMCSPWLYFDGKLFHNILAKTEYVKSLLELCNHHMDVLVKVERMRHAILENLKVNYARRTTPNTVLPYPMAMVPSGFTGIDRRGGGAPPGNNHSHSGSGPPGAHMRGNQRRAVSSRGGQLEVAGVVVCSWGANYSLSRGRSQHHGGMNGGRGYGRGGFFNDRNGSGWSGPGNGRGGFHARRGAGGPRRGGKTKRQQGERKGRGRGITDPNHVKTTSRPAAAAAAAAASSDELDASSDESSGRFDDAVAAAASCLNDPEEVAPATE